MNKPSWSFYMVFLKLFLSFPFEMCTTCMEAVMISDCLYSCRCFPHFIHNHNLDVSGPAKPGSTRKMLGSPRQLENAVPTSKNPHGVWV